MGRFTGLSCRKIPEYLALTSNFPLHGSLFALGGGVFFTRRLREVEHSITPFPVLAHDIHTHQRQVTTSSQLPTPNHTTPHHSTPASQFLYLPDLFHSAILERHSNLQDVSVPPARTQRKSRGKYCADLASRWIILCCTMRVQDSIPSRSSHPSGSQSNTTRGTTSSTTAAIYFWYILKPHGTEGRGQAGPDDDISAAQLLNKWNEPIVLLSLVARPESI